MGYKKTSHIIHKSLVHLDIYDCTCIIHSSKKSTLVQYRIANMLPELFTRLKIANSDTRICPCHEHSVVCESVFCCVIGACSSTFLSQVRE